MIAPIKSRKTKTGESRAHFQFPPINELVLGVRFPPLAELKAQHIGLYWQSIRPRFPECSQQLPHILVPAGTSGATFTVPGEIFPLPRFWFLSSEHPLVVQVQRDAFWLNWRRGPNSGDYPHYEKVAVDFWRELNAFMAFVKEIGGEVGSISRCELSYVNLIGRNSFFSGPADLGKVLPSVAAFVDLHEGGIREMIGLDASATYRVNENLFIDSAAKLGKLTDTQEIVMALELRAYSAPSTLSLENCSVWFKAAHEGVYRLFLDATSREMQKEIWKPL
jgi:uncharacterized protein (TIGR04255 family)